MTRTYALKRLLEHGPLSLTEIVEVTGWGYRQCCKTVEQCCKTGVIVPMTRRWCGRRVYGVPA